MYITRTALPRRTILRGLGAVISLPLLDAMVPAATALAATPAATPKRFGFMYIPHGADIWPTAAALKSADDAWLHAIGQRLEDGIAAVQASTGWLVERRGHAQPDALAGATPYQAAELANRASGIVVGKLGTATVSPAELEASFR